MHTSTPAKSTPHSDSTPHSNSTQLHKSGADSSEKPLTFRMFAAARAATGTESATVEWSAFTPHLKATTEARLAIIELLTELFAHQIPGEPEVRTVLEQSSFLIDGVALTPQSQLKPGARVDVLPPFAGG